MSVKKPLTYYPVHTMPVPLDVLWCAFPEDEYPNKPGPKCRPALVRSVFLFAQQTKIAVEVTYGTSKISRLHKLDLHVSNNEEMAAAGLPQASGFRLSRTIKLPWAAEYFMPRDGSKTPIIGHLTERTQMQLEALKVARRGKHFD